MRIHGWRSVGLAAALWGMLGSASARAQAPTPAVPPPPRPAPVIPPGQVMATVNGEGITYAQLEPVLKLAGPVPADLPEGQRRELYREALGMQIDDLLLQQFLSKHVPAVKPAAVSKKLAEIESALKEKKKTLADLYRETRQTEAQLRANIANVLQWGSYADKNIKDIDVQKYYNEFRDFFDRVTVRASHIVLRVAPTASASERAAARAKLLELRGQIVAGKLDFAAAAKAHSQCPSAPSGGDVGTFPRKFVVEESFARVAFALKPGEISDVVQTDYGLHLIKVTERKPGQPSDFNKIKAEVKEFYLEDLRQNLLVQLRKDAKIQIHLP